MRPINAALFIFAIACEPRVHPYGPFNDDDLTEPAFLCDEVISIIPADEISALGFSPTMAMSRLEGTMAMDATTEDTVSSTGIEISIEQLDGPITLVEFVDAETGEPFTMETGGDCESYIAVPVEAMFMTDDDTFAFAQDLDLQVTGVNQARFEMVLDIADNAGTYVADTAGADSAEYRIQVELGADATDGQLSLLTEGSAGDDPDSLVWAEFQTLLTFTTAL